MAEANDANNPVTEDGIGVSSSPDAPHFDPDGQNILGTVEDLEGPGGPSEGTLKTDGSGEGVPDEEKVIGEGEELPFHNHPRWKEVMAERDTARQQMEALKAEIEVIKESRESQTAEEEGPKYTGPNYVDITTKDAAELNEWQQEDPKGYAANLYAQMRAELWHEQQREAKEVSKKSGIEKTLGDYKAQNPEFDTMWAKGEIQRFIKANPGHNPISAHMIMTMENKIKNAAEKAAKETEAKVLANFKAKKSATVLGAGPGISGSPEVDKTLSNTKSSGGLTAVLTQRLQQMRKAS